MSSKRAILVDLFDAQLEELDRLAIKTGRSRAELIREAITVLIGAYRTTKEGACEKEVGKALDRRVA